MSATSTLNVPPEVSTSCTQSMNNYVTAYNQAYQNFQRDTTAWRLKQPSKILADYDTFMTELRLKHPVGYSSTDVDVLDADCKRIDAGYEYATHQTFGTCTATLGGVDCPGYILGRCKITDAEVNRLVDEWAANKPSFTPPDTEKIICMECLQHAENVIATGKGVINPDILQRALQSCSLVTSGTSTTSTPVPQTKTNTKVLFLGAGVVAVIVFFLVFVLFVV